MNDQKVDLQLQLHYKLEVDEILFVDLDFDDQLREQVRRHIQPELKRSFSRDLFGQARKNWTYSAIAAVIAVVLLMATPLMQDMLQSFSSETAQEINSNIDAVDVTPKPLMVDTNPSPSIKSWSVKTFEEAEKWFGQGMLVPSYLPGNFILYQINASGIKQDTAMKVIFTYSSDDQFFSIIEDKNQNIMPNTFIGYEAVDINGIKGYVKSDAGALDTELQWTVDGVQYMISGQISKEEVIRMAKSLK
jgi:hypothetical protein